MRNAYKQCAWERDIFAEDMKQEIKKDCSYLMLDIKAIKAEAYNVFAKRLKHKAINIGVNDSIVSTYAIDETLKEMVGEDNAK